jgi:hypothetical protein
MSRLTEATWLDVSRGGSLVVPVGATIMQGPAIVASIFGR